MRDEFPKAVADALAKRVGNQCSNPGCGKSTSAPHTEHHKAINIGVAAHITAASPGGPRYDASLSAEQRSAGENGIWLCQNCAKLIDNDAVQFPTHTIKEWKQRAEAQRAQEVIGRPDAVMMLDLAPAIPEPAERPVHSGTVEARPAESNDKPQRVPTSKQLSVLVDALEQFVWLDSRVSNPIAWAQEELRLPGFIRVADAIEPLRGQVSYEGWPFWMPELMRNIITIFDTIAHTWGWGGILKPEPERSAYMEQCKATFSERYLVPIQDAAKRCYDSYSVVDRPQWLEELIDNLPPIGFDFIFLSAVEPQLLPFVQPLRAKRDALLYGISYPALTDYSDNSSLHDFSAEVALAGRLGQATQKLRLVVKSR